MSECNHNCQECSQKDCGNRDLHEKPNALSDIKKDWRGERQRRRG